MLSESGFGLVVNVYCKTLWQSLKKAKESITDMLRKETKWPHEIDKTTEGEKEQKIKRATQSKDNKCKILMNITDTNSAITIITLN